MLSQRRPGPVRVLIGDGRPLFRAGLARMLAERPSVAVVGNVDNADGAFTDAAHVVADVAVLDVGLPGGSCRVVEAVQQLSGRAEIVLYGVSDETLGLLSLLEEGVNGFVDETADIDELVNTIESVACGAATVSPALTRRLASIQSSRLESSPVVRWEVCQAPTRRESDVLRLVAAGCSNREVASALLVSEHTVRAHLRSLTRKLNARNRMQAVHEAMRLGLLPE